MARILAKEWINVILEYLGKECVYCGSKDKLHIHHIVPMSLGGISVMGNLEVVCQKCHPQIHKELRKVLPAKKGNKDKECEKCGRIIHRKIKTVRTLCGKCFFKKKK